MSDYAWELLPIGLLVITCGIALIKFRESISETLKATQAAIFGGLRRRRADDSSPRQIATTGIFAIALGSLMGVAFVISVLQDAGSPTIVASQPAAGSNEGVASITALVLGVWGGLCLIAGVAVLLKREFATEIVLKRLEHASLQPNGPRLKSRGWAAGFVLYAGMVFAVGGVLLTTVALWQVTLP